MKGKMLLALGIMVLALGLVGTPDSWATTVNGVDFSLSFSGNTLTFTIGPVGGATGNWAGIDDLEAVEFKNIGLDADSGDTLTSQNGFTFVPQSELSASTGGCGAIGGGSGTNFCFDAGGAPLSAGSTNTFTFTTNGTFNLDENSVKASFSRGGVNCTGNPDAPGGPCGILSQFISGPGGGNPEPASLILLGAGLAGIGIWRRKAVKV